MGENFVFDPNIFTRKKINFSIIISKTKIMTTLRWKHIFIVHKKKFKVFLFTQCLYYYQQTEEKVAHLPALIFVCDMLNHASQELFMDVFSEFFQHGYWTNENNVVNMMKKNMGCLFPRCSSQKFKKLLDRVRKPFFFNWTKLLR